MARRSSRNYNYRSYHSRIGRDVSTPSLPALLSPPLVARVPRIGPLRLSSLSLLEDRRSYHPEGRLFTKRPFLSQPRSASRLVQRSWIGHNVAFANPEHVAVCVRRKARKQVLHAKGVAGRKGLRRPRRSSASGISC